MLGTVFHEKFRTYITFVQSSNVRQNTTFENNVETLT